MATNDSITYADAATLVRLMRTRELSACEVVGAHLSSIEEVNPTINLRRDCPARQRAEETVLLVQRILDAGAILMGKTNCAGFAAGSHAFNELFGTTSVRAA
jgi:Asp-tRNA(Asn)/Glu-tRNA(Gln) amidotransferase A subunit family amidase